MKQKYDSYKPSGIDWIGDIPSYWNIVRLGHIFNAKAGGDAKPELYSDKKDIQHPFPVFTNSLLEKQVYAYTSSPTFQSGSITVTGRGEIGHAFLRNTNFDAIIRLLVLTPRIALCCKYFTYFIDGVMEFFSDSAAVSQLSAQQINKELVIIPPLVEQEAIAAWLDEKCHEIDAAIAKVDREIELIDELKQSEISRVVTRGLNPEAPMRPSGIDWIGDIPEHWTKCRFKNFMYLKTNPSCSQVKVGLENLESGSGKFIESDTEFEGNGVDFCHNDILYGKLRPYLRKVWLAEFSGNAIGDFFVFGNCPNSVAPYLKFLLLSDGFTKQADGSTFGAKMPRVSSEFILTLPFYLPPLSEQQEIADYLDRKCAEIDGLKAKLTKKRETLTELRQSIISEVVTGKRKVI